RFQPEASCSPDSRSIRRRRAGRRRRLPFSLERLGFCESRSARRQSPMEYKEVVGRRRTIRYFQSWRPVEREKIQVMLEAALRASCAVNATFMRAIVVERDKI